MALDYCVVGNRIKGIRKVKGITQEQLAKRMGISVTYLSRIERGSSKINLNRISEICELLNVPMNYILVGTAEKSKDYLVKEFNEVLQKCTPDRQRYILEIAKLVSNI